MNESTNGISGTNHELVSRRQRIRPWVYVAIGLLLLIGTAYLGAFYFASLFAEPAFASIREIDPNDIESLAVLVINRPDGGPDISAGGKEAFSIPSEDFAAILAPLKETTPFTEGRPIYLGHLYFHFKDGRKLKVKLARLGDGTDPKRPPKLMLSIGRFDSVVDPLDKFLKPLVEVEARARRR